MDNDRLTVGSMTPNVGASGWVRPAAISAHKNGTYWISLNEPVQVNKSEEADVYIEWGQSAMTLKADFSESVHLIPPKTDDRTVDSYKQMHYMILEELQDERHSGPN